MQLGYSMILHHNCSGWKAWASKNNQLHRFLCKIGWCAMTGFTPARVHDISARTILPKYIPRSLWPTLEKLRPVRLLVTVTTGLDWLWILTAMYGTVIAAVDLQFR